MRNKKKVVAAALAAAMILTTFPAMGANALSLTCPGTGGWSSMQYDDTTGNTTWHMKDGSVIVQDQNGNVIQNTQNTVSTPSVSQPAASSGWTSDTNTDLTVQPGKTYQFKFTASNPNAINVWTGTPGVFNVTKVATEANAVYYKITAVGTPGAAAGIYVSYNGGSGTKLCVATIAGGTSSGSGSTSSAPSSGWTSDTNSDFTVQPGKTYQFKFTAANPAALNVWFGTQGVFTIQKSGQDAGAAYYKITAVGTPGAAAGIYVSYNGGSGTKLCVATVAGGTSSGNSSTPSTPSSGNTSSSTSNTTNLTQQQKDAVNAGLTLGGYSHEYEQKVFDLTNEEREKAGLPAFVWAKSLTEIAQKRAKELATSYSHTRPNGEPTQWENISMGGWRDWRRDENNQITSIIIDGKPEDVVQSWMLSDGHRANIMSSTAVAMAVGCYVADDGTLYWVQCFTTNELDLIEPTTTTPLL